MNQELCQEVISTFTKNEKTLFTAESCTAGLVTASLVDISGASKVLLGGVVAYSNDIKKSCLRVSEEILQNYGAVSFECVKAMVEGALEMSDADYALAITGIAGPDGGTEEKPVGTVFTAVMSKDGGWAQKFLLEGTREEIRQQSVEVGLKILLATELEQDFFDFRLKDAQEI